MGIIVIGVIVCVGIYLTYRYMRSRLDTFDKYAKMYEKVSKDKYQLIHSFDNDVELYIRDWMSESKIYEPDGIVSSHPYIRVHSFGEKNLVNTYKKWEGASSNKYEIRDGILYAFKSGMSYKLVKLDNPIGTYIKYGYSEVKYILIPKRISEMDNLDKLKWSNDEINS